MAKQVGGIKLARATAALVAAGLAYSAGGPVQAEETSFTAPPAAFTQALDQFDSAWTAAGLSFTAATFSDSNGSGYGEYTPRPTNAFASGERLSLYAEPVGYAFVTSGADFAYRLTTDYKLLNMSGQILAGQDGFAEFSGSGRSPKREVSARLSFEFATLPAGDYTLQITFNDANGGTSAKIDLPFSISAAE